MYENEPNILNSLLILCRQKQLKKKDKMKKIFLFCFSENILWYTSSTVIKSAILKFNSLIKVEMNLVVLRFELLLLLLTKSCREQVDDEVHRHCKATHLALHNQYCLVEVDNINDFTFEHQII